MRYFLSYLYHFLISNSRHGTHSPFIYELASKAIYNASYKSPNHVVFPDGFNRKYLGHLKKILSFWKIETLADHLNYKDAEAYWVNNQNTDIEGLLKLVDQGKILVIDRPYGVKQKALWKSLIADQRVTVSINMFYFGLVLHREGQRKEDFLLRYI